MQKTPAPVPSRARVRHPGSDLSADLREAVSTEFKGTQGICRYGFNETINSLGEHL
ncbi:MAG: hypothetical protein J5U16_04830 [Candidatus Methanoperedens sp.]|nr:hypothetical protein [Candidatus Methanoperedens sp.]